MIASNIEQNTSSPSPTPNKPKKIFKAITVVFILALVVLAGVWHLGSQQSHKEISHLLYSAFDLSRPHSKLLVQLQKNQLSIISGQRENGLIQFTQHLANKLSRKGKPIFFEHITADHNEFIQIVKNMKIHINKWVPLQNKIEADWILLIEGNVTSLQDKISTIQSHSPNAKIVIATTTSLELSGFKNFQYPQISENLLLSTIQKQLKVSHNVAAALQDYFATTQNVYHNLNVTSFNHKSFIGEEYKAIAGLSKSEKEVLKRLCTEGKAKSDEQSGKLIDVGTVFYRGIYYWGDMKARLNYEFAKQKNCENSVVPAKIVKLIQIQRLRQQQLKQARLLEQQRKEEERKQLQEQKQQAEIKAQISTGKQQTPKKEGGKSKVKNNKK